MSFAKLDRDQIIREAVALLKEEGLDAVSLRRIATRLGVSVSSLYWHINSKESLSALMSAAIFRDCLNAVPPASSWQQWLRDFGLAIWEAQVSIPDIRRLIGINRVRNEGVQNALETILATLVPLGLPPAEASIAQRSVQALVTGWTALRSTRPDDPEADRESFLVALDVLIAGWRLHHDDPAVASGAEPSADSG